VASITLAAVTLWLAVGRTAVAQGVVVVDQSAITAAQQNLTALKQQLDQLKALVNSVQNLAGAVGQAGTPSLPFQSSLSQNGLAAFSAQLTAGLTGIPASGQVSAGSALQPLLAQISQAKSVSTAPPGDPTNFVAMQQWVGTSLTNSPGDAATAKSLGRQARSLVAGETAADGYALALTARQQIATRAGQAQSLAAQIGASTTLRDDIAANSAVMLAIHDEMAEIQALLAASLALQSSAQLVVSDDGAPTSPAAATGGP
jgi:hypothetical protein